MECGHVELREEKTDETAVIDWPKQAMGATPLVVCQGPCGGDTPRCPAY